jgi:hypothetical protein
MIERTFCCGIVIQAGSPVHGCSRQLPGRTQMAGIHKGNQPPQPPPYHPLCVLGTVQVNGSSSSKGLFWTCVTFSGYRVPWLNILTK